MLARLTRGLGALIYRAIGALLVIACRKLSGVTISFGKLFGVDGQQVSTTNYHCGIISVHLKATSLQLNTAEWNQLIKHIGLPLRISHGCIDEVSICVGVKGLSLVINGLEVVVQTTNERHHDPLAERKQALLVKQRAIERLKQLGKTSKEKEDEMKKSRFKRLIQQVLGWGVLLLVRLVKVSIRDIHICVEDELTSRPGCLTKAGLRLKELNFSENKELRKKLKKWFVSAKNISVVDFGMYWDPSVRKNSTEKAHNFDLLKPLTVSASMSMSKNSFSVLEANFSATTEQVVFQLSKNQLKTMADVFGYLQHLQNTKVFMKFRPVDPVHGNAALWWKYALQCVSQLRTKWDWLEVKEQRDKRNEYQALYRQSLDKPSKRIQEQLMSLEDDMSLLNIMLSRHKVDSERDEVERKQLKDLTKRRSSSNSDVFISSSETRRGSDSVFRSRRSSSISTISSSTTTESESVQVAMTTPPRVTCITKPFVAWYGEVCVREAEFSLAEHHHLANVETKEEPEQVFTVNVNNGTVRLENNHNWNYLKMSVSVGYVQSHGLEAQTDEQRPQLLVWNDSSNSQCDDDDSDVSVFTASVTAPNKYAQSSSYDYIVDWCLLPSTVTLHWPTLLKISEYAALLSKSDPALKDAVRETVREIRTESKTRLKQFIRNKEVAKVTANVSLPTLVLPSTENSVSLKLVLGHLSTTTNQQTKDIRSNGVRQKYSLQLTGPSIKYCTDNGGGDSDRKEHTLCSVKPVTVFVEYTTFLDDEDDKSPQLHTEVSVPYIGASVSQSQIQSLVVFTHSQLGIAQKIYTILNTAPSNFEEHDSKSTRRALRHMTSQLRISPTASTVLDDIRHVSSSSSTPSYIGPLSYPASKPQPATFRRKMSFSEEENDREWDITVFSIRCVVAEMRIMLKRSGRKEKVLVRQLSVDEPKQQGTDEELGHLEEDQERECEDVAEVDEGLPYVTLTLVEVGVFYSLKEQSSCTHIQLNSLSLVDHSYLGISMEPVVLVETDKEFLIVDWEHADPRGPMFSTMFNSLYTMSYIDVEPFTVCLHLESVCGLLDYVTQLQLPKFGDVLWSPGKNLLRKRSIGSQRSLSFHQKKDPLLTICNISVKTITMRVTAQHSAVTTAIIKGIHLRCNNTLRHSTLSGHMQTLAITDELSDNKIVWTMGNNRFALLKLTLEPLLYDLGNSLTGEINIGHIKVYYLHKYIKTVMFVYSLLSAKIKQCKRNLMDAVTATTQYHNMPSLTTSNSMTFYRIVINLREPSILLPKSSAPTSVEDCLSAAITHLTLIFSNTETDTGSQYIGTGSRFEANLYSLQLSWNGVKLLSPAQLSLFRVASPTSSSPTHGSSNVWNVRVNKPQLELSPDDIRALLGIIGSNLSEDEPLKHIVLLYNQEKEKSGAAPTKLCCSVDELLVNLVRVQERADTVCCLKCTDMNITITGGEEGVVLELGVQEMIGTAGHMTADSLLYQRILYQHSKLDKHRSRRKAAMQLVIRRGSNFQLELSHTYICLWPQFLTSLLTLLKEFKSERDEEEMPEVFEEEVKVTVGDEASLDDAAACEKEENSNGSYAVELAAASCVVALLEDPQEGEVTSPGMCLEFKSRGSSVHSLVVKLFKSPTQWLVDAKQCDCQARLCIQGEQLIFLNQISSHCSPEFSWLSSTTHEKIVVNVPQVELHLTMEALDLLSSFYHTLWGQPLSSIDPVFDKTGCDIWVVKEMNTESILQSEDISEVFDGTQGNETRCEPINKHQEAHINLPEVVINLDIMCAGDNSTVMCLHSEADLSVISWSQQLQSELSLCAEAYIYNVGVASWEPLIEPVEDYETAEYRPWTFRAKMGKVNDARTLLPVSPSASSASHYGDSGSGSHHLSSPTSKSSKMNFETSSYRDSPLLSTSSSFSNTLRESTSPVAALSNMSISSFGSMQFNKSGGGEEGRSASRASTTDGKRQSLKRDKEGKPCYVIVCASNDRLELTVTPSAIQAITNYIKAIKIDHRVAMENIRNSLYGTRPPVQLQNNTGASVDVFPGRTFKDGAVSDEKYSNSVSLPHRQLRRFFSKTAATPTPGHTDSPFASHALSSLTEEEECEEIEEVDGTDTAAVTPNTIQIGNLSDRPTLSPTPTANKLSLFFAPEESSFDDQTYDYSDSEEEYEEADSTTDEPKRIDVEVDANYDIEGEEGIDGHDEVDGAESLDGRFEDSGKPILQRRQSQCLLLPPEGGLQRSLLRSSARRKKKGFWQPLSLTKKHKLQLQVDESPKSCSVPVSHPGLFTVPIDHSKYGNIRIVCDVRFNKGVRKVVLHSGVQVENKLPFLVTLYSCDDSEVSAKEEVEVPPGDTHDIPLHCVASKQLLRVGVGSGGYPSDEVLDWRKMVTESSKRKVYSVLLTCRESTEDSNQLYIQATITTRPTASPSHWINPSPCYVVNLDIPLVVQNQLPFTITWNMKRELVTDRDATTACTLHPGAEERLHDYYPLGETAIWIKFKHNDLLWEGEVKVMLGSEVNTDCKVYGYDNTQGRRTSKMYIKIQSTPSNHSVLQFFSSIWVMNKAGLDIDIERRVMGLPRPNEHNTPTRCRGNVTTPTILGFKPGKLKPEFRIRVPGGEWSDKFIVTTANKSINIISKKGDSSYMFSIVTHLLDNALTHIVHVLPKYSISNQTSVTVTCYGVDEEGMKDEDTIADVPPNEVLPFWPGSCHKMGVSLTDTDITLKSISLDVLLPSVQPTSHPSLPVVTVEVQPDIAYSSILVSLLPHADRSALLLVENHCGRIAVKFMQRLFSGSGQMYFLESHQQMLYSWDDPSTASRELQWHVVGSSGGQNWYSIQLEKATKSSKVKVKLLMEDNEDEEDVLICWETLFDGSQRVLRFWEKNEEYDKIRQVSQLARLQLFCSFEGVGVSLVNSVPEEVLYCAIASSPVVWKKSRQQGVWSLITQEESAQLEAAMRTNQKSITIADEIYDLECLQILSEKGGLISRCFNPGIWLELFAGDNWKQCSLKLGRLQVDNQLRNCELPTRVVFAGKEREDKLDPQEAGNPFLDFYTSVKGGDTTIREFEKTFLRVKPMQFNLELGVVVSLLPLVDSLDHKQSTEEFEQDMRLVERSLGEILHVDNYDARRQENYIDLLQIMETSLAVSYTTSGDYSTGSRWGRVVEHVVHFAPKGACDIKLKSVTLTNETTDMAHLKRLLWGHYKNELLWQFQKFALGLDVIGNPAQLVSTFQTGAKDLVSFSHQGIVEGDAMSGIAHGMKSFFGHVVEGSAGSAARSTGSLSNILLAMADSDYQKKHRHLKRTTADGFLPNIKLGSTFFLRGVFHGATDIVVKPVSRAAKEGVAGFFSGLGRGAVSILTKPTLAVVDLTQYTMEGVRSAVDDSYDQVVRRPRFIQANKILQPFNSHDAEGMYIQWHLSESLEDEAYVAHEWLPSSRSDRPLEDTVLLVTSRQVVLLHKLKNKYRKVRSIPLPCIEVMQSKTEEQSSDLCLFLAYKQEGKLLKRNKHKPLELKMEDTTSVKIMAQKIKSAKKSLEKQTLTVK